MSDEEYSLEDILNGRLEEDNNLEDIIDSFQQSRDRQGDEIEKLKEKLEDDESYERAADFYIKMEIRPWKREILQDAVSETDYRDIAEFMGEILETGRIEEREEYINEFEKELRTAIRERELDVYEQPEGLEKLKSEIENGDDERIFYRIFEREELPEYVKN